MPTKCFLRITDIEGDSTEEKFRGAIEVLSYSWGAHQLGTSRSGGRGSGAVETDDFSFTYRPGTPSSKLFLACATGRRFKEAVLECRLAADDRATDSGTFNDLIVSSYVLKDLIVSSFANGLSESGGEPTDRVTLGFASIEFEHRRRKADGSEDIPIGAGWDIQLGREI